MPATYPLRLCDVLRKHNRDRAADSLSDKGMICYYVDRAWCNGLLFHQRFTLRLIHNAVTHQFHIVEIAADVLN